MSKNPILTTRFNNSTFEHNCRYREINSDIGCIYGSPLLLNDKIQLDSLCFMIEMNNEENRIEGVGLIRNRTHSDIRSSELYSCHNYTRYVYKGKYRIDASMIERHNVELLHLFNTILFKGKSHMKRSSGISKITSKLYKKEICLDFCKNMLLMNPTLQEDLGLSLVDDNSMNEEIVEKMIKKELSRIFKLLKNENIK